ncbi:hypothetical protein CDN99_07050 [Roseateles aquatilis]|uniref:Alpha/beta hydrolase n=1 Tax=Roseateles aquatilis TaxID=431061 RepID=A0A246JHV6_9BURK|nr:hypothetical protein [Roseateles aquatilis]OWQ92103.1 hypothetical protein CDN99_07050 [Roseateles aquatilis]
MIDRLIDTSAASPAAASLAASGAGGRPRAAARALAGGVAGGLLLATALLLSACGGPPKARAEEQEQQRDFASRGYAPQGDAVAVQSLTWRLRGDEVRLSVAMAGSGATPRPVVLYLPGLGESETAGLRWRRAWAGAGYAVLSLQPLDEDATAWSSDLARAAEFTELGRRHYAEAEMRKRLARLDELLAEAQRLGRQGEAPWRSLDWSRTVVAGFELGAQSAMALAGERQADGTLLALKTVRPLAAIVISPQVIADLKTDRAERYRDIAMPVLSITGPGDADLLGQVRDTRWREAPFQAMPPDRRWLLSVAEVSHTALAGNEPRPEEEHKANQRGRAADSDQGQGRRGGGRGGRAQEGATRMAPVPAVPDYRRLHEQQLGVIAAQQVSVAFLDVQLKQSPQARAWLAGPAQAWMGRVGTVMGGTGR